jgi:molecular chaperone DnaK
VASGWTLAIDFGTSFTTAAIADGGQASVLEVENSRYFPSLVCLGEDGSLLTGTAARQLGAVLPDHAERMPKRSLVSSAEVRLGSRTVACTDLVGAVLGRMYREACAHQHGEPPGRVVLTHPAAWGDYELGLLTKAAEPAGLTRPVLLPEPVAAAGYYADQQALRSIEHVAVYDLGGGTFDVAVLSRRGAGSGFHLAGRPGGDPDLGGEDLTESLVDLVGRYACERDPRPWDDLWLRDGDTARREQAALRRDVCEAKEALSATPSVRITVRGYDQPFLVGRPEYEEAIADCLQQSLTRLMSTVSSAGLEPTDLGAVLLAGGASRTPRVGDLLAQRFGAVPLSAPDPKSVVALGALAGPPPAASLPGGGRERPPGDGGPMVFRNVTRNPFEES